MTPPPVGLPSIRDGRVRGAYKSCQFEGCARRVVAWGFCNGHHKQRQEGRPLTELRTRNEPNRIVIDGVVARILIAGGHEARVDTADLPLVAANRWTHSQGYALTSLSSVRGQRKNALLHRMIMNAPEGVEVDHIDGDGLNNCRSNLRLTTHAENHQNVAYKGRRHLRNIQPEGDGFRVRVAVRGREVRGGHYPDLASAQQAAAELRATFFPFANENRHKESA